MADVKIPKELAKEVIDTKLAFHEARRDAYVAEQKIFEFCVGHELWHLLKLSPRWQHHIEK